jgi:hypothetical protein
MPIPFIAVTQGLDTDLQNLVSRFLLHVSGHRRGVRAGFDPGADPGWTVAIPTGLRDRKSGKDRL